MDRCLRTLLELKVGDIVEHRTLGTTYIVTGNYGSHVTAVRTIDITNTAEWCVIEDELTICK